MKKRRHDWSGRGVVEIQFNWIFTLIIGGMILTFFFAIAQKQQQLSEKKIGAEILSELDLLFTGQGVSSNTITTISVPDVPVQFSCEDYTIMKVPRRFGNTILFSPETIKADTMIGMTSSWTVPFKVANFYYLTTPMIKYYVINAPEPTKQEMEDILPKGLDVTYTDEAGLAEAPTPNTPVRIIFFNTPASLPNNLEQARDALVTAVVLQGGLASLDDVSQAHFLSKHGASLTDDLPLGGNAVLPTIGKASVLGAMIAGSAELYECNMQRAARRLGEIASVYQGRASLLTAQRPDCTLPASALDSIIEASQGSSSAGTTPAVMLQNVQAAVDGGRAALEAANLQALRSSCPTLY